MGHKITNYWRKSHVGLYIVCEVELKCDLSENLFLVVR